MGDGNVRDPDRHLRLALRPLDRPVLPREAPQGRLARTLRPALRYGRDQQHVLPSAPRADDGELARPGAAGLPVRRQGQPVHHAHQETPQHRRGSGAVLQSGEPARASTWAPSSTNCRPTCTKTSRDWMSSSRASPCATGRSSSFATQSWYEQDTFDLLNMPGAWRCASTTWATRPRRGSSPAAWSTSASTARTAATRATTPTTMLQDWAAWMKSQVGRGPCHLRLLQQRHQRPRPEQRQDPQADHGPGRVNPWTASPGNPCRSEARAVCSSSWAVVCVRSLSSWRPNGESVHRVFLSAIVAACMIDLPCASSQDAPELDIIYGPFSGGPNARPVTRSSSMRPI